MKSRPRIILTKLAIAASMALAPCDVPVHAANVSVDIDPYVNVNVNTFTSGIAYPPGGSMLDVGGVAFDMGNYPGGDLGAIETGLSGLPNSVDVPVDIDNPTAVYTLINSGYGTYGVTVGEVEFFGTGGAYASFNLTEGQNIRDHYNGVYNNVIAPGTPSIYFGDGQVRFDEQSFLLPAPFATATLTDIRLDGWGGFPDGSPFLVAATVATVPEPGTFVLSTLGLLSAWVAISRGVTRARDV